MLSNQFLKIVLVLLIFFLNSAIGNAHPHPKTTLKPKETFSGFITQIKNEALTKGFSKRSVEAAFKNVKQLKRIIHKDHHQLEFKATFRHYKESLVTSKRVKNGVANFTKYQPLLKKIEKKYGIEPQYILALWGLETNYGEKIGDYSEFSALSTLAYNKRRRSFFKKQIFAALTMVDKFNVPLKRMHGSWAGAMGQCQFIPTSFLAYATDYDNSGYADIWQSVPDALASIANFLHGEGWRAGNQLLYRVKLSSDVKRSLIGLSNKQSIQNWLKLGVKLARNTKMSRRPVSNIMHDTQKRKYSLFLPFENKHVGYLVNHHNFSVIRRWNRSNHYALAIAILANKILEYKNI